MAQYDLVVFGATGFVGKLLCQYLQTHTEAHESLRWAIAGRSLAKLNTVAANLGAAVELPKIVADATDERSLRALCEQTSVVISTVGPYALYGETLVRVCAETGTDYCDLTGESPWIRRMIDRYAATAQQSGARIVHCCGFDSVPSDMGVYYLQKRAREILGTPCDRVKMRLIAARGGVSGGTLASGLNLVAEAAEDKALRDDLDDPYFLCPNSERVERHPTPLVSVQYDKDWQEWVAPFVMAAVNTPVVLRSNYLQGYAYGKSFQYEEGILARGGPIGWLVAQGLKLSLDALALAAALPPIRWALENTVLPASGEGPSLEDQQQGFYDLRFLGQAVDGGLMRIRVQGDRDPGYGSTAKILGQAGICLAQDCPKSALAGGFWTPAALMGDALLKRLESYAGVEFSTLTTAT